MDHINDRKAAEFIFGGGCIKVYLVDRKAFAGKGAFQRAYLSAWLVHWEMYTGIKLQGLVKNLQMPVLTLKIFTSFYKIFLPQ